MPSLSYKASNHPTYDSNVKIIQRNLNELRPLAEEKLQMSLWASISEDGYYGNDTAAAVKGFQQVFNCTPYDGIYGIKTDSALKKALSDMKEAFCAMPIATSINGASTCSTSSNASHSSSTGLCTTYETSSVVGDTPPVDASINNTASTTISYQDNSMTQTKVTSGEVMSTSIDDMLLKYSNEICEAAKKLNAIFSGLLNGINASIKIVEGDLEKLSNSFLADLFGNVKQAGENFIKQIKNLISKSISSLNSCATVIKELAQKFMLITYSNIQVSKAIIDQKIANTKQILASIGDKVKSYCSTKMDAAAEVIKEELLSGKIYVSYTKSRLKCIFTTVTHSHAFQFIKGFLKGIPDSIINFVEMFVVILNRNSYSDEEFETQLFKSACAGIDGLLLGILTTFLANLAAIAIFGSAAAAAAAGVVTAIGIAVGIIISCIYYVVAGRKGISFTEWVLTGLNSECFQNSLTFYRTEKSYSGGY